MTQVSLRRTPKSWGKRLLDNIRMHPWLYIMILPAIAYFVVFHYAPMYLSLIHIFYPENLEGGQRNFENGEITYCEAHHNMAIFYAQTDDPKLSVDVIPIGKVTSDLSLFEELPDSVEITFALAGE